MPSTLVGGCHTWKKIDLIINIQVIRNNNNNNAERKHNEAF